jgi:hypothetical protein
LGRTVWRDLRSYNSLTGNNFFAFVLLVAYQQVESSYFFVLILGVLLLFPLSADPLAKVPRERMVLWPLSARERSMLRVASLALSPAAWITAGIVIKTARPAIGFGFLGFAVALHSVDLFLTRLVVRVPALDWLRWIPRFPGPLGGLVRKDLRQILRVLDVYVALLMSIAGMAYRIFGRTTDPEAFPMLAIVTALALSTYAQCLFGLDVGTGWTRYRLLPLRGRSILLAKGIAFLLVTGPLVAGLDFVVGMTAALAALAVGHHASVLTPVPQQRWRFTGGTLFPAGLLQVVCMFGVGLGVHRTGPVFLAGAIVVYAGSVWIYGRVWDQRVGH